MRATTLPHMSLSRRRRPIKKMRKGHFFSQVKFDDDDFDDQKQIEDAPIEGFIPNGKYYIDIQISSVFAKSYVRMSAQSTSSLGFTSINGNSQKPTGSKFQFQLTGEMGMDLNNMTAKLFSQQINGYFAAIVSSDGMDLSYGFAPTASDNKWIQFSLARSDLNAKGSILQFNSYRSVWAFSTLSFQFMSTNTSTKFYFQKIPDPTPPTPGPQPGPSPSPQPGIYVPVNYGTYTIQSNHFKTYMNYMISTSSMILSNKPCQWQAKVFISNTFCIYSPQLTSYILIDIDGTVSLSPDPKTRFKLIKSSLVTANNKYILQDIVTNKQLSAVSTYKLGVSTNQSYTQIFQFILSLPQPQPEPQPEEKFQLQSIPSQYFKPLQRNVKNQQDFQFYNCGPPVTLRPEQKVNIPLGYKQGKNPKKTLKMLLKPHQAHFDKSILGRMVHVGKKGINYTMQLFNKGKKTEKIQTGEPCAEGILEDVADAGEDLVELI